MITCDMCQFLKVIISHMCRLIEKPVEYNDLAPSPNFECHLFGAEEEDYDKIPEEVSRLLEHEENTIQPYKEPLEVIIWVQKKIRRKSRLEHCCILM